MVSCIFPFVFNRMCQRSVLAARGVRLILDWVLVSFEVLRQVAPLQMQGGSAQERAMAVFCPRVGGMILLRPGSLGRFAGN